MDNLADTAWEATMKDQYHIDMEEYSLGKFKQDLQSREMIPSRVSLKDDLEARFIILESAGITNMKELVNTLKTRQKIESFSAETGLPVEYLTLLKREANSYQPAPIRLDRFPSVASEHTGKLSDAGIKNSRQMFNQAGKKEARQLLSQETGLPMEVLDELAGLSDLSRAYGIGPVFARMLYDAGISSIQEFSENSAADIVRLYEEATDKRADFGLNEMQFSLDLARELETPVEV
jgi:predicted flap endonuclease-1-like 5' DNA nuclease